ncbi:hypothetical protein [Gilvibacter sediminis]|uniref:hypothetical protein n=1 Tax=Gilvibacter sediminis TaxID=379071 RepID=UPI002350C2FB|nr:hypothetical protein [Gilvibacter sediminis]MDC7997550.1 hypothetical protein [Gilvibacter sediminis]
MSRLKRYWQRGKKQKRNLILLGLLALILLFILRDDYQPALLFLRKYIFLILLSGIITVFLFSRFRRSPSTGARIGYIAGIAGWFGLLWYVGWSLNLYQFMQSYNVFSDLNKVEIHELPLTQNERIQPFNNIVTMAYESIGETQEVSLPHLVRVDGTNQWTMAVQPAEEYIWQRINDNTEELFNVDSTTPFPRFSEDNRVKITFSIGESLAWSRNTYNAVVQRFGFFKLFTYEPSDVFYMKNDDGKWVQVVSLIKWKGFFFPYPTYGGVMVIEPGEHDFGDYVERILIGKGTYYSPEETKNYPYLQRQNILAEQVSRMQAQSLQFLGGFTDPLPWNKKTAVKIPDLEADQNQQPFVTDFNWEGMNVGAYDGLYHWFGLEPIGDERTTLSFSVMIPADGTDQLFYYNHASKNEGLAGVSAMPLKVIESRKEYDWSVNRPVEFRPFIKYIGGRKRMFVITTVTSAREDSKRFDGAATPDLALIDTDYRDVVWIDAKKPLSWGDAILDQLGETWKADENLTDQQLYPDQDLDFQQEKVVDSIIPLAVDSLVIDSERVVTPGDTIQ